jgi:hypothetical protein
LRRITLHKWLKEKVQLPRKKLLKTNNMRTRTQEKESKPIISLSAKTKKAEAKILNLAIHLEKLTVQLSDGRELSIPIN